MIIPSGGTRFTETELLFCAHHLRRSAAALRALGVAVYDQRGDLLDGVTAVFVRDQ